MMILLQYPKKFKQNHLVVKSRSIPPLKTDDDLICDNLAKCELFNDFFSVESNMDYSNSSVPEPIDPLYGK